MQFTKDQLTNWKAFERVRSGGRYNMFDARARQATGMSGERYSFTMTNYSALKEAVGAAGDSASDRKRKSPTVRISGGISKCRVKCEKCGREQDVDGSKALARGWPECHGYTMTLMRPND